MVSVGPAPATKARGTKMIEVKIDTAEFTRIEDRIRNAAKQILSGSALKKEVGDFAVERLKYQARTGRPFNNNNQFPQLAESTIKNRRYLSKNNPTHQVFDAKFSNLTITGDLLDHMTWVDEGDTLLKIVFQGMHRFYYGAKGQRISKPISNELLAKYLEEKGFRVFDKSLQTNKQFIARIKTICLRYIRRGLRIRNAIEEYGP